MVENSQVEIESSVARTSKHIAYFLLGLYGVALLAIGLVAAYIEGKDGSDSKPWLDLFKSGFLILGGGLTTVIGYYFGSRGEQQAQSNAKMARHEAEKALRELGEEKEKIWLEQENDAPTYDEESMNDDELNSMET